MNLSKLTVKTQLLGSYGLIILLIVVAIMSNTFSIQKIVINSNHVNDESFPFALLADEIVLSTVQVQQWLTDVSATHNPDGYKDAEESALAFKEGLNRFKVMFEEENEIEALKEIEEIEVAFDKFYQVGKQMANAYIANGMDEGNKLMEGFDVASAQLANKVTELRKSQANEAEEMIQGIVIASSKAKQILYVLGAIITALCLAIGYFITMNIQKQLGGDPSKIAVIARRMADGDLTLEFADNQNDVGVYAAMKDMVNNLGSSGELVGKT